MLLLQSWWPGFNPQSFNYPAWSISVEYYLYMIFAVILLFAARFALKIFIAVSTLATVGVFLGFAPKMEPVLLGLSCFFAGVMTYQLYQCIQNLNANRWLFTVLEAVGLILVGSVMTTDPAHQQVILMLLFCSVILIFSFEAGILSTLLKARPFERLGTLSYSIYMTHAMILFAFTLILLLAGKITGMAFVTYPASVPGPMISFGSATADNLVLVILLGVIVGLSTLTYHVIELRGIQLGKRWAGKGRAVSSLDSAKTLG